jgi:hypothetical protein
LERGVPQVGISTLDDKGDPGLDERFGVASDVISEAELGWPTLAVVNDPFGNALVLLDLSAGRYVTDVDGRVLGVQPRAS